MGYGRTRYTRTEPTNWNFYVEEQDTTCITMIVGDNLYLRSSGKPKIMAPALIVLAAYTGVNRGNTATRSLEELHLDDPPHGQEVGVKLTSLSNK